MLKGVTLSNLIPMRWSSHYRACIIDGKELHVPAGSVAFLAYSYNKIYPGTFYVKNIFIRKNERGSDILVRYRYGVNILGLKVLKEIILRAEDELFF